MEASGAMALEPKRAEELKRNLEGLDSAQAMATLQAQVSGLESDVNKLFCEATGVWPLHKSMGDAGVCDGFIAGGCHHAALTEGGVDLPLGMDSIAMDPFAKMGCMPGVGPSACNSQYNVFSVDPYWSAWANCKAMGPQSRNLGDIHAAATWGGCPGFPLPGAIGAPLDNWCADMYPSSLGDCQAFQYDARAGLQCRSRQDMLDGCQDAPRFNFLGELRSAVESGNEPRALRLVRSACERDVNALDGSGRSALHYAAARNFESVCRELLSRVDFCRGGDYDEAGCTALHHAAANGHADLCWTMLDHPYVSKATGVDVKGKLSPLHCAAGNGHACVCRALLEHPGFLGSAIRSDTAGLNALHVAARAGHANACSELLNNGRFAGVNELCEDGLSALHLAAMGGHADVCRTLMHHPRFRVASARTRTGQTAADVAVGRARQALERVASPDQRGRRPPVPQRQGATRRSYSHRCHPASGPNATSRPPPPPAPLGRSGTRRGCSEGPQRGRLEALYQAMCDGNEPRAVELIEGRNPELNRRTRLGMTKLHVAAAKGMPHACRALLNCPDFMGVNSTCANTGWTALHFAASCGHPCVCKALLDNPRFTVANDVDTECWTALHFAASNGYATTCEALLCHPRFQNVWAMNREGRTALDIATGDARVVLRSALC